MGKEENPRCRENISILNRKMHGKRTLERYYMCYTVYTRSAIKDKYMFCIWYSEIVKIIEKK